jgi:FixJ family two-component response regulator
MGISINARFADSGVTPKFGGPKMSLLSGSSPHSITESTAACDFRAGEVAYLIAGDARLRENLADELTSCEVMVRSFPCASEYLECARQDTAACLICDLPISDIDAFDLQRHTRAHGGPPTIFTSADPNTQTGVRAMKAGAFDFLFRPLPVSELIVSIREAFEQDRALRQERAAAATLGERYAKLTPREREVLGLVVKGLLNKQVAQLLAISLITVQIHRRQAMRKMSARSFADLVCMAMKLESEPLSRRPK